VIGADDYATRAFPEAQALLKAAPERVLDEYVTVGWFDSDFHAAASQGSFALVDSAHEDLLGDVIGVRTGSDRIVYALVYMVADTPEPILLSRRAFLGLALLPAETVDAIIEVLP
jgi:hypothetical protein